MSDEKEVAAFAPLNGATASQEKIEECEKKAQEYLAGWQRARADFLNYKKEEVERVKGFLDYANEEFVLKLLPIMDNFEVCKKGLTCDPERDKNVKGLLMVKSQLEDFLKSRGVEEVVSVGEKFNPNLHEVIQEIEGKDKAKGTIVEEVQKGYKINGRILRPAKVKVVK